MGRGAGQEGAQDDERGEGGLYVWRESGEGPRADALPDRGTPNPARQTATKGLRKGCTYK